MIITLSIILFVCIFRVLELYGNGFTIKEILFMCNYYLLFKDISITELYNIMERKNEENKIQ